MARLKRSAREPVAVREYLIERYEVWADRYQGVFGQPYSHMVEQLKAGERVIVPYFVLRNVMPDLEHGGMYEVWADGSVSPAKVYRVSDG